MGTILMATVMVDHALSRWSTQYLQGMHPYKDPRAARQLETWMRSAGFTEVASTVLTLPMSAWPTGTVFYLAVLLRRERQQTD